MRTVLVLGPEASGTKMLQEICIKVYGCHGVVTDGIQNVDLSHEEPVCIRYSLPTGYRDEFVNSSQYLDIASLIRFLYKKRGPVDILFISRNFGAVAFSRRASFLRAENKLDKNLHTPDWFLKPTRKTFQHFFYHISNLDPRTVNWYMVSYEDITGNSKNATEYYSKILGLPHLGLDKLDWELTNQNIKWLEDKNSISNTFGFDTY